MSVYRFRDCVFDIRERRVEKGGKVLNLTSKTLDILTLLVENAGEVVTRDEILGKDGAGRWSRRGIFRSIFQSCVGRLGLVMASGLSKQFPAAATALSRPSI
jgi:DNA-binding winged helix-turn-helix (wHTH) protein